MGPLGLILLVAAALASATAAAAADRRYLPAHRRLLQQTTKSLDISLSSSGYLSTCAINDNFDVYCWGDVSVLGNRGIETGGMPSPVVSRSKKWKEVSNGAEIVAGLANDNSFWTWGYVDFNDDVAEADREWSGIPRQHGLDIQWVQVTAGVSHSCAIASNQSALCFGSGIYGELGNGQQVSSEILVVVNGDYKWAQLSAGYAHTCGLTIDGIAACWGRNRFGVLGVFDTEVGNTVGKNYSTPTPIANPNMDTWKWISAGYTHTCAINDKDDLYCWGDAFYGQCGNTTVGEFNSKPTLVMPGVKFVQVNAGGSATSALTTTGEWWGWGVFNTSAAPETPEIYRQSPKKLGGRLEILELYYSREYSHWTAAGIGQRWSSIGSGQDTFLLDIYPIIAPFLAGGTNYNWFIQTSGSAYTHCALAVNGTLWCFGSNEYNQIGPQEDILIDTPTPITGSWVTRAYSDADGTADGVPPAQADSTAPASSDSTAAIVGGVVGGIAVIGICAGGFLFWKKKKRDQRAAMGGTSPAVGDADLENAKPAYTAPVLVEYPSADAPPDAADDPFIMSSAPSNVSQDAVLRWAASQVASAPPPSTQQAAQQTTAIPDHIASLAFNWDDCKIIRVLGVGSFGEVFLAQVKHARVAVKVLVDAKALDTGSSDPKLSEARSSGSSASAAVSSVTSASRSTMLKEVSIMAALRHPNVVQLNGFCMEPPCLALEFCARGSLYDVLHRGAADPKAAEALVWDRRIRMATDAAAGMIFLHSRNPQIVHRDVKTLNFLVGVDWTVKVADMGLSKMVEEATGRSSTTAGGASNPRWLSPEVLQGERYAAAADVYSFGIVLWELLMWKLPWVEGDVNVWGIVGAVLRGERPRVPTMEELPGPPPPGAATFQAYTDLMQQCWDQDPTKRPTMEAVADELSKLH